MRGHIKYRSDDSADGDVNPVNKHDDVDHNIHDNYIHDDYINNTNDDHDPGTDLPLSVRHAQRELRD